MTYDIYSTKYGIMGKKRSVSISRMGCCTECPGTERPGTERPGTERPGTECPGTERLGTECPGRPSAQGDQAPRRTE